MVLRDGFHDTFVDVGGHIYSRVGEYGDFYRDLSRYYLCQRGFPWATALDIISGGHIGHLNIGPGWLPWPTDCIPVDRGRTSPLLVGNGT